MKDFLGQKLKYNDTIVFLWQSKLFKGYINENKLRKDGYHRIQVKFWHGNEWDYVVIAKNDLVKVNL